MCNKIDSLPRDPRKFIKYVFLCTIFVPSLEMKQKIAMGIRQMAAPTMTHTVIKMNAFTVQTI